MITADYTGIKIAGITSAVPTTCVKAHDYDDLFGEETITKNVATVGIQQTFHASEFQTSSDFAYVAAKRLLEELDIDPQSIGVLLFDATFLDYHEPPTACVLHHRLNLAQDCIVFDVNLACSGYVYGLQTMCSLLKTTSAKRGLFLTGDIASKVVSPYDKSRLLFGDGGSATLIEKTDEETEAFHFAMKTDGSRFKSIIVPAGGYRNIGASYDREEWFDGNIRSDYDLFMNGPDVFSFTMSDVPEMAKAFLEKYHLTSDDFDSYILHQPNLFILKHLMKKLKAPQDKLKISLDRFGNTSVCSIPITICDAYHDQNEKKKLFLYGFGVGLSWACASVVVDTANVFPIEYTDDYYTDGAVAHH